MVTLQKSLFLYEWYQLVSAKSVARSCTKMFLSYQKRHQLLWTQFCYQEDEFRRSPFVFVFFLFTVERLYQCLAFIHQPEPTYFISLSQVSPREEINKHGLNQPFGNIVQNKVLKSLQKDFSGCVYKKPMVCVFFFFFIISLAFLTFCLFVCFLLIVFCFKNDKF